MEKLKNIEISAFDYDLPDDRIARYPLENREDSKLLILNNDEIVESKFKNIGNFIPKNALLVFNDTKVVRARLLFRKPEGALIELFTLEPFGKVTDMQLAFTSKPPVLWKCLVGNSKRWKTGHLEMKLVHDDAQFSLFAKRLIQEQDHSVIEFSWNKDHISFAEILEMAGEMPLPPYLGRKAENADLERYQTVFAKYEGSVAAPTAGLHLTDSLIKQLQSNGIEFERLTLHVGAGTFKPVSTQTIGDHTMHAERISFSKNTLLRLMVMNDKPIIPVGTTSLRALESLFWIAHLIRENIEIQDITINQWLPYQDSQMEEMSFSEVLLLLIKYLDHHKLTHLQASTSIMIVPGYRFRIVSGLITNFHQPKSTLLLLVSAMIGERWHQVYQYALDHNFRFLSYGDSCFFSLA